MLHESEKLKQKVMTFIMVINGQCPPLTQSKGTLLQPLECSGELNSLFQPYQNKCFSTITPLTIKAHNNNYM